MTAKIIDGKLIAEKIKHKISKQIKHRLESGLRAPGLAVIIVGNDPASEIYVYKKRQMCKELGIISKNYNLAKNTSENKLLELISNLNSNKLIDGILVQLPLPKHINSNKVIESISPQKDVDGFHPFNIGKLSIGKSNLSPCTPKGIITLLNHIKIDLPGKNAVIIGASNIVGKPMGMELINSQCTVTICHKITKNLPSIVKQADIVISATGTPNLVKHYWIKKNSIVIDVGMNRLPNGKLVGDVDFDQVKKVASWITPVPGGVGPMTVVTLMENTLCAAQD